MHNIRLKTKLSFQFITNYVLMNYGTGAIFGCPAHDERDYEFAQNYKIKFISIIKNKDELPYTEKNKNDILQNSNFLDGLILKEAEKIIVNKILQQNKGRKKLTYKLRDWGISSRDIGDAIPIAYSEDGSASTVDESELPITLPEKIDLSKKGNPLANHPLWKFFKCKKTNRNLIRETDTLDTFFDSSWYFLRFVLQKTKKYHLIRTKQNTGCL